VERTLFPKGRALTSLVRSGPKRCRGALRNYLRNVSPLRGSRRFSSSIFRIASFCISRMVLLACHFSTGVWVGLVGCILLADICRSQDWLQCSSSGATPLSRIGAVACLRLAFSRVRLWEGKVLGRSGLHSYTVGWLYYHAFGFAYIGGRLVVKNENEYVSRSPSCGCSDCVVRELCYASCGWCFPVESVWCLRGVRLVGKRVVYTCRNAKTFDNLRLTCK
jgi:hypothetical protein